MKIRKLRCNYPKEYLRFMFFILSGFLTIQTGIAGGIDPPQDTKPSNLRLASFDVDATPPVGSTLAYNIETNKWDLGLRARGIVLLGAGQPIVLCAIDWIEICSESQDVFRRSLADAAGTIQERVVVHTLHQHDAPICDFGAERILKEAGLDPQSFESSFAREVIHSLETAIRQSLKNSQPLTHVGLGEAQVYKVASNRRVVGEDGRVRGRMTACKDSALIAAPEGVIDPMVSLISFWNGDKPLAVLSYYATHPQSYYMTGVANPDFPGIARFYRQLAVPEALHIHFNGAGGNVAAGKYNDGSKENRGILAERLADGMKRAWETTKREAITANMILWEVEPVSLPPATYLEEEVKKVQKQMNAKNMALIYTTNHMMKLSFLQRCQEGKKIDVGCLTLGRARSLFLPGELFVEYQLAAKAERPDLFVTMAAYGDCAPGYIGTAAAYKQSSYETGREVSSVSPEVEGVLMSTIRKLLHVKQKVTP
jgi:hypothetical protein